MGFCVFFFFFPNLQVCLGVNYCHKYEWYCTSLFLNCLLTQEKWRYCHTFDIFYKISVFLSSNVDLKKKLVYGKKWIFMAISFWSNMPSCLYRDDTECFYSGCLKGNLFTSLKVAVGQRRWKSEREYESTRLNSWRPFVFTVCWALSRHQEELYTEHHIDQEASVEGGSAAGVGNSRASAPLCYWVTYEAVSVTLWKCEVAESAWLCCRH